MKHRTVLARTADNAPNDQGAQFPVSTSEPHQIQLRILATSDLHAHILPFDYYSGTVAERLGLTRTASLIAAARAEVPNCLLLDNGDFLQGSPLGDFAALPQFLAPGNAHPVIAAMNYLRYDAGTLGNHDFNYGVGFLTESLAWAGFPVVSANVLVADGKTTDTPFVPPFVILDRMLIDDYGVAHPVRIGIIGFSPPQIVSWDERVLAGKLATRDIVDTAIAQVPRMRTGGADLIIALSHSGIGSPIAVPGMENASCALANIPGIDVVIAGHSHLVFPSDDFVSTPDTDAQAGTLCGKPAVMPGSYGSHLGVIDLVLVRVAGRYQVQLHRVEARPIWRRGANGRGKALVKSHLGLTRISAQAHRDTLNWANRPIGHTDVPLHSYFALVTNAPALQFVAAAQALAVRSRLAMSNLAGLPVLSSVAPFKAGGRGGPENYTDVPAGDVMLRHAADLYIHPNTSAAIRVSGAEIANWLEYSAGIFNQIAPRSIDQPLINPDFPSFNFEVIFGLRYQIDLAQLPRFNNRGHLINPQSRRIVALSYHGEPIDPSKNFIVATNSYRVSVSGDYLPRSVDRVVYVSTEANLDVVKHHFAAPSGPNPYADPIWQFSALPGTSVTFDTSPKAVRHVSEWHASKVAAVGLTPTGFMRFRLHL